MFQARQYVWHALVFVGMRRREHGHADEAMPHKTTSYCETLIGPGNRGRVSCRCTARSLIFPGPISRQRNARSVRWGDRA
jgi:hypothetical protein